ncbi:DUF1127 domain-containing protein [Tabrizicola sp.]|mgnify:CR=1 FL=1|jgi:uncharacterized protein YjiS (DUF1127 family)|uniref:DUF1127 domain-containing protein n=1 Tax=Tabrizicola sp. TaxID=2005166 RepID=UPI001A47DE3A|nr:DUF1127 domain-containing protein [Tabrizicola sp.]MBL9062904.1 DUF1127 domain-containing protein [Tabrizicola sp.]
MPQTHVQTLPLRARPGVVARLIQFVTTVADRRRNRQQLGHLDAHLLRDIGVDVDTARDECAKPFWRP